MSVAFIDSRLAQARPYYDTYRHEPISASAEVRVSQAFTLNDITMESLLRSIADNVGTEREVLVVAHARDSGIAVPVVAGGPALDYLSITRVSDAHPDTGALSADFGTSSGALDRLIVQRDRVRALRLARVDFRGCNLGRWEESAGRFKNFFGATAMSCLDLRSGYASFGVGTIHRMGNAAARTRSFEQWASRSHLFPDGTAPNRFGFRCDIDGEHHRLHIRAAAAESEDGARAWIASRFGNPTPAWNNGSIYMHGLINVTDLIYPYSGGRINPDYGAHIVSL